MRIIITEIHPAASRKNDDKSCSDKLIIEVNVVSFDRGKIGIKMSARSG